MVAFYGQPVDRRRILTPHSRVGSIRSRADRRRTAAPINTDRRRIGAPINTATAHKQEIDTSVLEGEVSYRAERCEARLAYWGVRAPLCEWFEVKGAWMGPNLDFRIGKPPDKRANDICKQGWS